MNQSIVYAILAMVCYGVSDFIYNRPRLQASGPTIS